MHSSINKKDIKALILLQLKFLQRYVFFGEFYIENKKK